MSQDERAREALRARVAALYEESRGDVFHYLLTLGLGPAQAQEAAQEVFVRLYATLRRGEEIERPRAWIFRVAHNLGLKLRTRESPLTQFAPGAAELLPSISDDPERELLERERMSRFQAAMGELSERQRSCLLLRLEGLRYPEIGAALGISASAAGEFLRRAIERIRKYVL